MQRLEVSCAVRRIYTSLGAKGLIIGSLHCYMFRFPRIFHQAFRTTQIQTQHFFMFLKLPDDDSLDIETRSGADRQILNRVVFD